MKRLIFTLYHDGLSFCLSRNFKLQNVGDADWLIRNYGFSETSYSVDELFFLYVDRNPDRDRRRNFLKDMEKVCEQVFVPTGVGGNISSLDIADLYFEYGADKVVINRSLFKNPSLAGCIADRYGRQAVVASIDVKYRMSEQSYYVHDPITLEPMCLLSEKSLVDLTPVCGEYLVQSIDNDGNGCGYDNKLLTTLAPMGRHKPLIVSGGAGKPEHFVETIREFPWLSGVSTGNLFNFLGGGLAISRKSLEKTDSDFPCFSDISLE